MRAVPSTLLLLFWGFFVYGQSEPKTITSIEETYQSLKSYSDQIEFELTIDGYSGVTTVVNGMSETHFDRASGYFVFNFLSEQQIDHFPATAYHYRIKRKAAEQLSIYEAYRNGDLVMEDTCTLMTAVAKAMGVSHGVAYLVPEMLTEEIHGLPFHFGDSLQWLPTQLIRGEGCYGLKVYRNMERPNIIEVKGKSIGVSGTFDSEVTYWFREEDNLLIQYSIAGRTDRYESIFMARIDPKGTW